MPYGDIKDFSSVLASIVTALATLAGVLIANHFNIRTTKLNIESQLWQKSNDRKIEKLEQIYLLFERWYHTVSSVYMTHYRCHRGHLEYSQVQELMKQQKVPEPGEAQKYKVLMDIHFSSLNRAHARVELARKNLVPFLGDPKKKQLAVSDFDARMDEFEEACSAFKSAISEAAKETTVSQRMPH